MESRWMAMALAMAMAMGAVESERRTRGGGFPGEAWLPSRPPLPSH